MYGPHSDRELGLTVITQVQSVKRRGKETAEVPEKALSQNPILEGKDILLRELWFCVLVNVDGINVSISEKNGGFIFK